jgi:hypothetical protein
MTHGRPPSRTSAPDDDTTCPHGEDTQDDCRTCTPDEEPEGDPGPNGCVCGFNGDCNCPFVETL